MPLIIGSTAFAELDDSRIVRDLDIVSYKSHVKDLYSAYGGVGDINHHSEEIITFKTIGGTNVEIFVADVSEAWKHLLKETGVHHSPYVIIADEFVQYSIKLSHITIPKNFHKHIEDLTWLGTRVKWVNKYPQFCKLSKQEAEERHANQMATSVNGYREKYFDAKVDRWFRHEDIHSIITCYPKERQLITFKNPSWIGNAIWSNLDRHVKCKLVMEEITAIALERKIIPFLYGDGAFHSSWEALKYGMMKLCTELSNGWMQEFIIRNYFEIMCYYDVTYDVRFVEAVSEGRIKLVGGKDDAKERKVNLQEYEEAYRATNKGVQVGKRYSIS